MISYFIIMVIIFIIVGIVYAIWRTITNIWRTIANAADKATETPLMKAAVSGDVEKVNELLSTGVNIDETNVVKNTALSLAIIKNQEETACALINAGANLTMACRDGKDAFDLVLATKNERILLQLIEKVDAKTLIRFNLLAEVAKYYSVDVLRELFNKIEQEQKGISAKISEGNKYSDIDWALWRAAENRNIQNVDFLLEKGASLAAEPILAAVMSGSVPLVKKFIELGDNIEAKNNEGLACLVLAVKQEEYEIVELLLENKANPSVTVKRFNPETGNYYSQLLFNYACDLVSVDMGSLLLKYGAKKEKL